MRFVVDAQLPPALARWLVSKGHDAEHVADVGLAASSDDAIWQHAKDQGAVIVSKDDDFAVLRTLADDGPQIVWVRFGNASRHAMLTRFERILPELIVKLERSEILVEIG